MSRAANQRRAVTRSAATVTAGILALVVVAGLVAWFGGRVDVVPANVLRAPLSATVGEKGGSWYCAARDIGVGDATFNHALVMAVPGAAPASVILSGYDTETRTATTELELEPRSTRVVDVGEALGSDALSVMVESDAPVVVEHRFTFEGGADQAPCSTFSSDTWYFPVAVTTRDAAARLSLFNPFPGDASVDIQVALETGVRIPDKLSGLVVPAGSTLVVDLAEYVERRAQFAFTVSTRSGGVVAELAQYFDGSNDDLPIEGLRLVPGSRRAAPGWSFAGGFADSGARERLVVLNPDEPEVQVLAQPFVSGAVDVLPEPFTLSVPALRYAMVDIDADSRVPVVAVHAIDVEAAHDRPVVAARSIDITGVPDEAKGPRAMATGGTSAAPGVSVATPDWLVAGLQHGSGIDGAVFVHNPGTEAVVVELRALTAAASGEPASYELAPGDVVAVGAKALGGGADPFSVLVHAEAPVVVERLLTFTEVPDISLQSAVPLVGALDELEQLSGS